MMQKPNNKQKYYYIYIHNRQNVQKTKQCDFSLLMVVLSRSPSEREVLSTCSDSHNQSDFKDPAATSKLADRGHSLWEISPILDSDRC